MSAWYGAVTIDEVVVHVEESVSDDPSGHVQHPLDIAFDQIHPAEDLAAGEVAVEVLHVE